MTPHDEIKSFFCWTGLASLIWGWSPFTIYLVYVLTGPWTP